MQGIIRVVVCPGTELLASLSHATGITMKHLPSPIQERRQKARHDQDEAGPYTVAPPLPPPQSNWERLFSCLNTIEYQLESMDIRMWRIKDHLGIPPPHDDEVAND